MMSKSTHVINVATRTIRRSYHHDVTLDWAKQNQLVAQSCLNPPSVDVPKNDEILKLKLDSLEDYAQWRRWPHSSPSSEIHEKAMSLSSHVLSAPLTMALFYSRIGQKPKRICCVGARAEATLPHIYWKEFLLLASSTDETAVNASLDFVGPDISKKTPDTTISMNSESSLAIRCYFSGLLHETSDDWDAYVLFNPGIGHDNLINGWRPTLERIVAEGRPTLLTAHSQKDAERDTLRLQEHGLNVNYTENPFASRITYEDPFDPGHIVNPSRFWTLLFGTNELAS